MPRPFAFAFDFDFAFEFASLFANACAFAGASPQGRAACLGTAPFLSPLPKRQGRLNSKLSPLTCQPR